MLSKEELLGLIQDYGKACMDVGYYQDDGKNQKEAHAEGLRLLTQIREELDRLYKEA